MTINCLRMSSGSPPLDDKKVRNDHNLSLHVIGLTASGLQKEQNDHNLSLRATEHDRFGWQKVCGMIIICLCMSSGSPPLDEKRAQNDHNLSLRGIGHDCLRMAKW